MHLTAYNNCLSFCAKYLGLPTESPTVLLKVLDVGSLDINGTVKPIFLSHPYVGFGPEPGKNVDVVGSSHEMPFPNEEFDVIVSTSWFGSDEMFWLCFLEMCRVVKNGGYIYINTPSSGPYNKRPVDCWRFYPDSWAALAKWAEKKGFNVELIESYTDTGCEWKNAVGIFRKRS